MYLSVEWVMSPRAFWALSHQCPTERLRFRMTLVSHSLAGKLCSLPVRCGAPGDSGGGDPWR